MAEYNLDGFEIGEFKTVPGFGLILPIISFMILTVIIRKKKK
jgi:hypothetical protein